MIFSPAHANTDQVTNAQEKVAEFLAWERQVKPSGIYSTNVDGRLHSILSEELLCLLYAASTAREIAIRTTPDEKPPFVEGNPFLPNAWDHLSRSDIISSRVIASAQTDIEVNVAFTFGELDKKTARPSPTDISTYLVAIGKQGARIIDIDIGGSCDFCQSGSLRVTLYEALLDYPASGYQNCKDLSKLKH